MTNEELFQITNSVPLFSRLKLFRLRWAGHVNRMHKERFLHVLLNSVLKEGSVVTDYPRLGMKDVLKRDMTDFTQILCSGQPVLLTMIGGSRRSIYLDKLKKRRFTFPSS